MKTKHEEDAKVCDENCECKSKCLTYNNGKSFAVAGNIDGKEFIWLKSGSYAPCGRKLELE